MNIVNRSRLCSVVRWSLYVTVTVFSVAGIAAPALAVDFGTLMRRIGKVSDDVPINRMDEVIQDSATSRAGRDLLEKTGVRLDNAADRSRALKKAWQELLGDADPSLLKQIDELPEPSQQSALLLARGTSRVESTIPDIATRSAFLRDGGADTLAAVGLHRDLMDDALRFDLALRGGRLTASGNRALTLNDFGRFFLQQPNRSQHFWTKYVRPHWKAWLGGSALTAVMLAPEEYLDDIGDLTREGARKITAIGGSLLGDVLAGIADGVGKGTKDVLSKTFDSLVNTFFSSVWGGLALLLLISIVVLAIPFTRALALGVLARAVRKGPAKRDMGGSARD